MTGAAAVTDPTSAGPGVTGFLVMFFLALATVFLVRSMVKHLRKVRYGPGPDGEPWDDEPGRPRAPDDQRRDG